MRREDGPRSVIGRSGNAQRIWVALVVMTLCLAVAIGGNALLARYYIVATVPQGENILRLAVSGLRGELARYERLPDLMDRNPVLVRALAPDADPVRLAAANLYLRHLARLMGLSDAYVMAPDGMTVAASNFDQPFSFVGERFDYRPYFTDALAGGQGRFSALGTTSGKRGYYFGRALRDRGRIVGVLVLKVCLL